MAAQVALRRQQAQEESEARELRLLYPDTGVPQGSPVGPGVAGAGNNTAPGFDVFGADNPKDGELEHELYFSTHLLSVFFCINMNL